MSEPKKGFLSAPKSIVAATLSIFLIGAVGILIFDAISPKIRIHLDGASEDARKFVDVQQVGRELVLYFSRQERAVVRAENKQDVIFTFSDAEKVDLPSTLAPVAWVSQWLEQKLGNSRDYDFWIYCGGKCGSGTMLADVRRRDTNRQIKVVTWEGDVQAKSTIGWSIAEAIFADVYTYDFLHREISNGNELTAVTYYYDFFDLRDIEENQRILSLFCDSINGLIGNDKPDQGPEFGPSLVRLKSDCAK